MAFADYTLRDEEDSLQQFGDYLANERANPPANLRESIQANLGPAYSAPIQPQGGVLLPAVQGTPPPEPSSWQRVFQNFDQGFTREFNRAMGYNQVRQPKTLGERIQERVLMEQALNQGPRAETTAEARAYDAYKEATQRAQALQDQEAARNYGVSLKRDVLPAENPEEAELRRLRLQEEQAKAGYRTRLQAMGEGGLGASFTPSPVPKVEPAQSHELEIDASDFEPIAKKYGVSMDQAAGLVTEVLNKQKSRTEPGSSQPLPKALPVEPLTEMKLTPQGWEEQPSAYGAAQRKAQETRATLGVRQEFKTQEEAQVIEAEKRATLAALGDLATSLDTIATAEPGVVNRALQYGSNKVKATMGYATQGTYEQQAAALVPRLRKVLGEKNAVMSDQDAARIQSIIPGFSTTRESARKLMQLFTDIVVADPIQQEGKVRELYRFLNYEPDEVKAERAKLKAMSPQQRQLYLDQLRRGAQ